MSHSELPRAGMTGDDRATGAGAVPESHGVPVADLDRATGATAVTLLRPSCASARWIERLVSGRPYGTVTALVAASDATISALAWADLKQALAAHPRIGDRPESRGSTAGDHPQPGGTAGDHPQPGSTSGDHPQPGSTSGDREAAWSRQEQAGTRDAPADVQAGLRAGNAAYEERFGHVFLICAAGMSATSMLAALQARLAHDPATEREVVREELTKIVRLRLGKTFE